VNKNTLFFSTYEPEYVFKQLIGKLGDKNITPEVLHNKGKLIYENKRVQADEEKEA